MSNNSSSKSKTNKGSSKLSHLMLAPFRGLVSLRDLYVSSLGGCAGRVQQGRIVASSVPRSQSHGFYNSRTGSGGDADIRDLIRAASQGKLGPLNRAGKDPTVVPRSQSVAVGVGIARIDEDEAVEFSEDYVVPRSRSVAVVEKRRVGVFA